MTQGPEGPWNIPKLTDITLQRKEDEQAQGKSSPPWVWPSVGTDALATEPRELKSPYGPSATV